MHQTFITSTCGIARKQQLDIGFGVSNIQIQYCVALTNNISVCLNPCFFTKQVTIQLSYLYYKFIARYSNKHFSKISHEVCKKLIIATPNFYMTLQSFEARV
ncbi:hypothetical protein NIES1031_16530 [Chroogloeocystis siderophila 5.2 s.c.1]|uniref:Uncharacterized protein n=1 Tax=Chroogloeocystis siderophila 5.2 s.c.1 TaxID=247279 RepID=A0A1U7HK19_9CHRO|nr:hypothetical protein NIES1031_16530 [Chroogloeocystis siderophila 5.2 s.c.1]